MNVITDFSQKTEYFEEIFENQKQLSKKIVIKNYFSSQQYINEKMRHILIDWLWDVTHHEHFKLQNDTFFICISILDRFISNINYDAKRKYYQLIGLTAMFIACKINEIYFPDLDTFKYICDNAYSVEQIKKKEIEMCNTIDHFIPTCTVYYFVEILILKYNIKEEDQKLFFDLSLVSLLCFEIQCKFSNYEIAISLLNILNQNNDLVIEEEHDEECLNEIYNALKKIQLCNKSLVANFDKTIKRVQVFLNK